MDKGNGLDMDGLLGAVDNFPLAILSLGLAVAILWWLQADRKKQREWREAKELKIADLQRRIADKKKQVKKASLRKED